MYIVFNFLANYGQCCCTALVSLFKSDFSSGCHEVIIHNESAAGVQEGGRTGQESQ